MTSAVYEQADLFTEVPDPPPYCLFHSQARGLAARITEFGAWTANYGQFGCRVRSHAWTPRFSPAEPTGTCRPSVMSVDVRRPAWSAPEPQGCDCVQVHDALLHRGACTGCDWEGPPRGGEGLAIAEAHDHSWPGWRDPPTVPPAPATGTPATDRAREELQRWISKVSAVYPPGWLEAGGPIRTARDLLGSRSFWPGTPFGGYNLAYVTAPRSGSCRYCGAPVTLDAPGQVYRLAADATGTCPSDRDSRHRPVLPAHDQGSSG